MKINKLWVVIVVVFNILLVPNVLYAKGVSTVVMVTFDDNTEYRKIGTPCIFGEYLLSQLDTIESFSIVEHIDETVSQYKENLVKEGDSIDSTVKENVGLDEDDIKLKKAIANDDFEYMLFQNEINIDQGDPTKKEAIDSNEKQANFNFENLLDAKNDAALDLNIVKNTFIPRMNKVVRQYNARYALCGSIDYLKSGIEEHTGVGSIPAEKKPYIEVGITAHIIDVVEEKILWSKKFKGIDKDTYIMTKYINVGTSELNSDLFYDAIEKVSKKLVREISKDLKKGKITLEEDDQND